jgi:uncharacterized membrane protein
MWPIRIDPMSDQIANVRLTESTRVEAFSDAVVAIIITILVLELRVPAHEPGQLLAALSHLWASIFAFLISFLYIGVIWLNHHALFARIRYVDRGLHWINLGILLTCALIPFPTAVLAEALREGNAADLRIATALYAVVAGLMSAAWIPIFPYLRDHPELIEPGTDASFFHAQRIRPWIGVVFYAAAIAIGFLSPGLALALFTLMIIFHAVTSEDIRSVPFLARQRPRGSDSG